MATYWYKMTAKGLVFNHAEVGIAKGSAPVPKSEVQKQHWAGVEWVKVNKGVSNG